MLISATEVCMDWILDFLYLDSGSFQQDQEWDFLNVSRIRIVFTEKTFRILCLLKKHSGCLLDLYLPWLIKESDCLNLVGTGSGLESD